MLFNSIDFAIYLPVVFVLYWFITNKSLRLQNVLILLASYVFYAWWDWRFLSLIFFSTLVDYFIGLALHREENKLKRKLLLWASIAVNLGFLGFFKYYNFFVENFNAAFSLFGRDLGIGFLHIILPVGISFYTFQTLSYTIDIYKKKLSPTTNFINFAAFVSFFPQLVAGPIERAKDLLPQFSVKRKFEINEAKDGLRQILWGLFKKMVVADNCAVYANEFFGNYTEYSGSTLFLGAFFFTIQIYCDFSGYSDIAIGTARLFGFRLTRNFAFPYFARNVAEFWRRWHISLTTWFKDYLYFPIGGSKKGKWMTLRNTIIIFVVIGLWHGAQWKFVVYGFINSLVFIPLILFGGRNKYGKEIAEDRFCPSFTEFWDIFKTFVFVVLVRVFFRAEDLMHGILYLKGIFSPSLFSVPDFNDRKGALLTITFVIVFLLIEWGGRAKNYAIETFGMSWSRKYRWAFYYAIVFCIFYFYGKQQEFIYFQF